MKALMFSGGKDSMACLLLHKRELANMHVVWGNTGKNYPEVLRTIEMAKAMCPHWHEVRTDRDAQNAAEGVPADVVPVMATSQGAFMTSTTPTFKVQPFLQCCFANIIGPVWAKVVELGCEAVIRGQRNEDNMRGALNDGDVYEGIKIEQPIQDWSTDDVLQYLTEQLGSLPTHFHFKHSSMDCYDCTAYIADTADRIAYTKAKHPQLHQQFMARAVPLWQAINAPMLAFSAALTQ